MLTAVLVFSELTQPIGNIVNITQLVLVQRDTDRRLRNARSLGGAGFKVKESAHGESAYTDAVEWPAGVVVTDMTLTSMNGYELCRRLRGTPRTAETFVLGVSEWTSADDHDRAMQAGFDHLINAHSDPQTFLAEVLRIRPQGASLRRKAQLVRQRASEALAEATMALTRSQLATERSRANRMTMTRDMALRRIRSDYFELPGLSLTIAQGARLWGLHAEICGTLLEELTVRGFLCRAHNQYFRR